jgi:hypothetical protein
MRLPHFTMCRYAEQKAVSLAVHPEMRVEVTLTFNVWHSSGWTAERHKNEDTSKDASTQFLDDTLIKLNAITILTPRSGAIQKLTVCQLSQIPRLCGTQRLIIVFTRPHNWSLSWARWTQSRFSDNNSVCFPIPPCSSQQSLTVVQFQK